MKAVKDSDPETIFAQIRADGSEVIIFGAGVAGEALFHVCRENGVSVACFCDNNVNKSGKILCGIPVRHVSEIGEKVSSPCFLISAADIKDVVEQLLDLGYERWHDAGRLLQDFDVYQHSLSVPPEFADYVISSCSMCHQAYLNPDALFLRSVDIVITERCSLRCRDCANLMQYYNNPGNHQVEDILNGVNRLAALIDDANEVRVIGGEPLMSPAFTDVVQALIREPKFRRIIIYTNGTICPPEERLIPLIDRKVLFFITDYGRLSKNINRLREQLQKLGIQYHVQQVPAWCRCGTIGRHGRRQEENNAIFHDCCAKHLVTLMNGHLYCCPFSANAVNLKAAPRIPEDSVCIIGKPGMNTSLKELRRDVFKLLSRKIALDACDYCEGRPFSAPEIEPAVQASVPLAYQKVC